MEEIKRNCGKEGNPALEKTNSDKREKNVLKYANRLAFSKFVSQLSTSDTAVPLCCDVAYPDRRELHRHINSQHHEDISRAAERILSKGSTDAKWKVLRRNRNKDEVQSSEKYKDAAQDFLPISLSSEDKHAWLPTVDREKLKDEREKESEGRILLFYRYREIQNTLHVKEWQQLLCNRLELTGKVRIAKEGLNVTVGGTCYATELYMTAVMSHPLFSDMVKEHFKTSSGGAHHFPDGLRVGIYEEAVPMGIKPEDVSYREAGIYEPRIDVVLAGENILNLEHVTDGTNAFAGIHLTPEQFHEAVNGLLTLDSSEQGVLIDCRNFYESKIGCFDGAVRPDIRKFSYWPEYVNQNPELFRNREVYMYCTGGIRCERGSAYLKAKGLCKEVYQLDGGIHKYIEKYPDGYFKGKLFVFDDRYAIAANDSILSVCAYCQTPWDDYKPCTCNHCHQLVLICSSCRKRGHTACCPTCQQNNELKNLHEQCDCTARRVRIPVEKEAGKSHVES